jgi:hypothetical protein
MCDLWRRLSAWGTALAKDLPWFPFYPADWLTDVNLRTCSAAARGIWIDMICVMDKSSRRGYLEVNGFPMDAKAISRNIGESPEDVAAAIAELERAGVLYREASGTMYCKRMVEDTEVRDKARQNGRRGGNPRLVNPPLNPEVNPPVNPGVGNGVNPSLTMTLSSLSVSDFESVGEINATPGQVVEIYRAYPRQVGRGAALKAIARALHTHPPDVLLAKVREFAASPLVKSSPAEYVPHPATWFNAGRYDDDPAEWQIVRNGTPQNGSTPHYSAAEIDAGVADGIARGQAKAERRRRA